LNIPAPLPTEGRIVRFRILLSVLLFLAVKEARAEQTPSEAAEFFEREVRPLLVEHCQKCHGAEPKLKGGLNLTTRALLLKGGDSGAAVVPGKPDASLLIKAIRYADDDLKMPPKSKLSEAAIAKLVRWVESGAPWPETVAQLAPGAGRKFVITDEHRRWWSFLPVKAAPPPTVKETAWLRSDLDRFILAKLEEKGIEPAPPADKRTLIRRATFDLTGLPPTPEDIDAFLKDESAAAFTKVVDRLLASPAYGERWGRHWLDVVRYADNRDSRGLNGPEDIGDAWRYRDWVIDAFNRDLPYDRFILEQIAGDVLPPKEPGGINTEGLVATGLLTIGEWGTGDADKEKMLTDIVDDQINVVSKAFLGLTLGCARCHDHKFDPIPQADYYGLAGIFFSTHILPDPGPKTNGSPMLRTPLLAPAELARRDEHQKLVKVLEESVKRETEAAYKARAREMLTQTAKYLLAAHDYRLRLADGNTDSLAAFADRNNLDVRSLGRWVELSSGDKYRLLPNLVSDVAATKGVFSWRGKAECPNALINTTARAQPILSFKLPPRSVSIHPGPSNGVAAAWLSPVHATLKISGRVADLDPNCGDGVAWRVDHRRADGLRRELATGDIPNGGASLLDRGATSGPLAAVEVSPGDRVELVILPKANHTCDTTLIELTLTPVGGGPAWDLTRDLLDDPAQGNPHRDGLGHAGVWHLLDMADGKPLSAELPAALADWHRAEANTTDRAALERSAADFQQAFHATDAGSPFHIEKPEEEVALAPVIRDRLNRLRKDLDAARAVKLPPIQTALAAQEGGVPNSAYGGFHDARIYIRGLYTRPGEEVPRHFPVVLAGDVQHPIAKGSGRLELARWIAASDNPLTARVMVNRLWQYHFGEGIVRTPNNFGKLGEQASHPELLDWLASKLVSQGWSVKAMHRLLMLSATYRQSSVTDPQTVRRDPDNRLFSRATPRRLEAEELRDALLVAAGRLDRAAGGPAFPDVATPRRSVYLRTVRSDRTGYRFLFDAPDPENSVDKRTVSTVAPQALFLLNHPFARQQAKALAKRLQQGEGDDKQRISRAYLLLYGRPPSDEEFQVGREFLARRPSAGWTAIEQYAHLLLCGNEFVFID
jgi:mono/diheme cytochrome c family protein